MNYIFQVSPRTQRRATVCANGHNTSGANCSISKYVGKSRRLTLRNTNSTFIHQLYRLNINSAQFSKSARDGQVLARYETIQIVSSSSTLGYRAHILEQVLNVKGYLVSTHIYIESLMLSDAMPYYYLCVLQQQFQLQWKQNGRQSRQMAICFTVKRFPCVYITVKQFVSRNIRLNLAIHIAASVLRLLMCKQNLFLYFLEN